LKDCNFVQLVFYSITGLVSTWETYNKMNKIQGCLILLLSLLPTSQAQDTAVAQTSSNFETSYGLTPASCPTLSTVNDGTTGWYIDQAYDSPACFPRQVECTKLVGTTVGDPTGSVRECPTGYTFISNNTDQCYSVSSSNALAACGVTVDYTLDGIKVYVTDAAVFEQTGAKLQFGATYTGNTPDQCTFDRITGGVFGSNKGGYVGELQFSTTDVADCNVERKMESDGNGGYYIQYEFMLKRDAQRTERVEVTDLSTDTVITREKCFMANVQCNYDPDGVVTSRYQPSSPNALDEHDESNIDFDMKRVACNSDPNPGQEDFSAAVYVTEPVCFRTKITTDWHQDIRISTPKCWVTPYELPKPEDKVTKVYNLFDADSVKLGQGETAASDTIYTDSTLVQLCEPGSIASTFAPTVYEEAFQFDAFRFQSYFENDAPNQDGTFDEDTANNVNSYAQTMYVHCEVNACKDTDRESDECKVNVFDDCFSAGTTGQRVFQINQRARRAAPATKGASMLPKLTKSRVVSTAFVLPARERMNYVSEEAKSYSLLSDTLSLGLFAVGCVFAVVAIGMYVAMKRQMRQLKYSSLTNNQ